MSHPRTDRPYKLELYNPVWKNWFRDVAAEIAPLYGDNLITVEHIGSTAIDCADMWAKPNIDVLVVVHDIDTVPSIYESMLEHGYVSQGREYVGNGDENFTKDDPADGRRLVSVHTYQKGSPQIRTYRAFREYLKANPEDRAAYVALKQELFTQHAAAYTHYDAGKQDLITEIKARAATWAEQHLPTQADEL